MSSDPQKPLSQGVQRVAQFLQHQGHTEAPVMLADAARTAQQAADALGVQLGQIAKSIVFKRVADGRAVLVITSGDLRVDEALVSQWAKPETDHECNPSPATDADTRTPILARADAAFVKAQTGFSIGGVSPIAHSHACVVLLDQQLFRFNEIWAAAGHPHAVFKVSPQALQAMTHAPVVDVTERVGLAEQPPAESATPVAPTAFTAS